MTSLHDSSDSPPPSGQAGGPPARRIDVLFVEDDLRLHQVVPLVADGLGLRFTCVGTAAAALSWLVRAGAPPDLALVDLGLPDLDGVELIQRLVERAPGLAVVVLSAASTQARIVAAMRAGACGYLVKEDLGSRLRGALLEALDGGVPMSTVAARAVLGRLRALPLQAGPAAPVVQGPAGPLSSREREVVEQLSRGLTYDQVGQVLGVSINTIRVHVRAVYEKLGAATRTEAILAALRLGLVEPP